MALRIALTGATGFVGRAVAPKLVAAGHNVCALVRNPVAAKLPPGIEMVRGDLSDAVALAAMCKNADVLLHIAGSIQGLTRDDFFRTNFEGTKNVVAAAQLAGVKRMVHVSSLAARLPDISSYAASKNAAEDFLLRQQRVMPVLILRPAAVYGEGDVATLPLLKALMSRFGVLPGRATNKFSLIHVDDLAEICIDALRSVATGVRELDDGQGGYRWDDLVAMTQQAFGRPGHYVYLPEFLAAILGQSSDVVSRMLGRPLPISADKMRELYHPNWIVDAEGWPRASSVNLAQGLVRTIIWYQARGMLPACKLSGAHVGQQ